MRRVKCKCGYDKSGAQQPRPSEMATALSGSVTVVGQVTIGACACRLPLTSVPLLTGGSEATLVSPCAGRQARDNDLMSPVSAVGGKYTYMSRHTKRQEAHINRHRQRGTYAPYYTPHTIMISTPQNSSCHNKYPLTLHQNRSVLRTWYLIS